MKKRLRTVFLAARIKLATSVVSAMEIMQTILRDGLSAALGDKSVLTNVENFRNSMYAGFRKPVPPGGRAIEIPALTIQFL